MNRRGNPGLLPLLAVALLSTTGPAATAYAGNGCADTNGDNVVDVQDLTNIILDWGCTDPPGPCIGDVTGDGVVDVGDLTDVILTWGECEVTGYVCNSTELSPPNDCCAEEGGGPIKLSGAVDITLDFDTTNAQTDGVDDPSNPCGSAAFDTNIHKDLWYLYNADADGLLTVSTCKQAEFDTKIAIYAVPGGVVDCSPESLIANFLECNEDCTNPDETFAASTLEFFGLQAGETYLIRLGSFSTDATPENAAFGPGQISFEFTPVNNDLCEFAEAIAPGESAMGSTCDANPDEIFSCGIAPTEPGRWHICEGDGTTFTASLCAGTDFDSNLTIYCGAPFTDCATIEAGATPNDCAEPDSPDSCGINERISWCTEPGKTYYIYVHGEFDCGNYTLALFSDATPCDDPTCQPDTGLCGFCDSTGECMDFIAELDCMTAGGSAWVQDTLCETTSCPVNDDCADAIDLGTGTVSVEFDNTLASAPPDGPPNTTCDKFADSPGIRSDIWFRWTSGVNGAAQIDNCGGINTKIAVYPGDVGCPPPNNSDIACNDDDNNNDTPICDPSGTFSAVLVPVVKGQELLIRVGQWGTEAGNTGPVGQDTLNVTEIPD